MVLQFEAVRAQTERLVAPLENEDFGLQAMADASPPKWHLAHTTWFFETFVLIPFDTGYEVFNPHFEHLFNSYYNGVGTPFPRHQRGQLSRPTVAEVFAYRRCVDEAMTRLLAGTGDKDVARRVELGLHHEQQHQELLLTDLKYNFSCNPIAPAYRRDLHTTDDNAGGEPGQLEFEGGMVEIGARDGFAFDNETPRHKVHLHPFALADRLVTNGEFADFIEDGGYENHEHWLSDGWATVREAGWQAPIYWRRQEDGWTEFTLAGERPLDRAAPVVHVSGYEADAFARWSGARLPSEAEWEHAAADEPVHGNFVETDALHPQPARGSRQMFGDVWEWTSSAYGPYPGYRPLEGTLGEYNGKFMANQLVLRGGSCATPEGHMRASYRNFLYPPDRWQFSGIRLAYDV